MSGDSQNINPQIRTVEIGIRTLRNIKIYPMSMADQVRFINLIDQVLNTYFTQVGEGGALTDKTLAPFLMSLTNVVGENIKEFISIVTDSEEVTVDDFLGSTTNTQMSKIVTHIIEDNFEEPSKNVLSLVNRFKDLFLLKRLSPQSSNDILSTISPTSTEEDSETED